MHARIANDAGFIAALDQSGGSTPKALAAYGVGEDRYKTPAQMFDLMHGMRSRIILDESFTRQRVLGAILFEQTMDRQIQGLPTAQYLWEKEAIVPFVKVDQGLAKPEQGVQLMKPMDQLAGLLSRAQDQQVFGTKMRSVIHEADPLGIAAIVEQQGNVAQAILSAGLMPIVEPEISIHAEDKARCEALLLEALLSALEALPSGQQIMLKLTLPEVADLYEALVDHPKVLRVVALSGGYSLTEATARLSQNKGIIASFSRALTQDLVAGQSDQEFSSTLSRNLETIHNASVSASSASA